MSKAVWKQTVTILDKEGFFKEYNKEVAVTALKKNFPVKAKGLKPAYPASMRMVKSVLFMLMRGDGKNKALWIVSPQGTRIPKGFEGKSHTLGNFTVKECPLSHENADRMRKLFNDLAPVPLGIRPAFGCGDRLGIAGAGHVRASVRCKVIPILAQQSIREMTRTVRTPEEVMDSATWAAFQEGYTEPFGSDADHLQNPDDLPRCVEAGFTMFTIDPSEHVENRADDMPTDELDTAYKALFDSENEQTGIERDYLQKPFIIEGPSGNVTIEFTDEILKRTAVKYYKAVLFTVMMNEKLKKLFGRKPFDLEMSVDETETPTTPAMHLFVANELKKRKVHLTSLAPRFTGEFQKAIDYIGDTDLFRTLFAQHVAIANAYGPYKLSIHSGSDKFSVFPIIGELAGDLVHEKTAGTSYLEAIRVVARHDAELFREIYAYSLERFETDRHSYHVTTDMENARALAELPDSRLPDILDDNDGRQILHITYGSILTDRNQDGDLLFHGRILELLENNEEEHYETVSAHIERHMQTLKMAK